MKDTRYLVISRAEDWARLWKEHDPESPAPRIDFSTSLMVCVFHPKWAKRGFRIDRISPNFDLLSYTVALRAPDGANARRGHLRYAMALTDRTRCDFQFVVKIGKPGSPSTRLLARRSSLVQRRLVASLRTTTLQLLDELGKVDETPEGATVLAKLTVLGDPVLPLLHDIVIHSTYPGLSSRGKGAACTVLLRMHEEEVARRHKPIRFAEIAIGRAIAEIGRRVKTNNAPAYMWNHVRQQDGIWFVATRGTFAIYSNLGDNEKDVHARIALRAKDGKILQCRIRRGHRKVPPQAQQGRGR